MEKSAKITQREAAELAAGYSSGFRKVEIASIAVFFALMATLGIRLLGYADQAWGTFALGLVAGWLGADFFSGLIHWSFDTWGSPETPIIGQSLIRTFREHHVDEKSITRHDFIELNGSNCMATLPMLFACLFSPLGDSPSSLGLFTQVFVVSLAFWVFGTNQVHQWSHKDNNPLWIRNAQDWGLIMSPKHHEVHHTPPFTAYYCITTGWLNPLLHRLDFFRRSERLITRHTGALPRKDDIGEAAAQELAR